MNMTKMNTILEAVGLKKSLTARLDSISSVFTKQIAGLDKLREDCYTSIVEVNNEIESLKVKKAAVNSVNSVTIAMRNNLTSLIGKVPADKADNAG